MIGKSMLARVIAAALVFGASAPLMAQDYGRDRGHQEDDEEVRRVGRRGREDGESASEEAHDRNAERAAEREAEWLQHQQEQQQAQQQRQAEQQQREQARAEEQQQRAQAQAYEQQQREAEQQQRRAEREQRQQAQAIEQRQRDAVEYQRQVQQQEAEQQRGERVRERDQSREAWGMQQERERQQGEQMRQAELQRQADQRAAEQQQRDGRRQRLIEVQRSDATDELQRLERERYQVERGGDRERYEDFRGDRDVRRGAEVGANPEWRDRDQTRDAQSWGDPRRRWNTDGRQVPTPRDGVRLSDRERQSLYTQQRQFADRYRRDYPRHIQSWEQRSRGLQSQRRLEQYRYQQRYWQRHRDYHTRWYTQRWNFERDPFFWTAPSHRYYRGGRWFSVNRYAVDVLQQAVRIGYEEGFHAGEADRYDGWRGGYRDNFVYQDASLGYQGWYVGQAEYNYYFREGFRRGYEDGYYRRFRYGRRYDTGFSILPRELDLILRFEAYR